jgi:hypothetical protein
MMVCKFLIILLIWKRALLLIYDLFQISNMVAIVGIGKLFYFSNSIFFIRFSIVKQPAAAASQFRLTADGLATRRSGLFSRSTAFPDRKNEVAILIRQQTKWHSIYYKLDFSFYLPHRQVSFI